MPADSLPGTLCIPLPASPGCTVSQADLDGKQAWLHPGASLPGGRQVDPQGQPGGSAPLSSISQYPHPLIPAQGSPSESLDLSPGAPGFDWSIPPWQPQGHLACPSGRLSLTLGLASMSLCHSAMICFHTCLPRRAPSFPSRSACPCPSPSVLCIVPLAQSGHRGSLAGTAVRAEGRALGRWCECQGPSDTVGPWILLLGLRDSRWSWCDGVPLPLPRSRRACRLMSPQSTPRWWRT